MSDASVRVFDSGKFTTALKSIRLHSLSKEFPVITMDAEPDQIDWNFTLFGASILASTSTERAQNAVLRIASGCLSEDVETEAGHKHAAAALLERVGNHRAVQLAESRNMVDPEVWTKLPPLLRLEIIRTKLRLSIPLSTGENLEVNTFQEQLWAGAKANEWLSVSAPTSAGKSRIVREWFLEQIRQRERITAVYLAPTRALVEEVSADFRKEVPAGTGVIVMPWDPDLNKIHNRVLVLTQERLHLIQESQHPFEIDFLFVDEAQGLGGAERGLLLQQVIDRTTNDNPRAQVIFASPLSSNPELLLSSRPAGVDSHAIVSEAITVNQNLLRVEGVHRSPAKRRVSLVHDGEIIPIGEFELLQRATRVPMRLAYVAQALGGEEGGNIVYVNGADEAEKVAQNIADLSVSVDADDDIRNLQELVKTAVHPRYSLADVLEKGVAFHYGNMPLAIRAEIERLFGLGKIKFLVCTSTLLEGVNLPCRTIFVRNPQKGRGNPMSEADFWNLAGRAGRWGKEFQGNIVCIDTDDPDLWPNLPTTRRRSQLSLATQQGLLRPEPILDYVRSDFALKSSNSPSENLFSYLAAKHAAGADIEGLLSQLPSHADRAELRQAVEQVVNDAEFPQELIARHAGISPVSMQRLLSKLRNDAKDPHDLVLALPEEGDAKPRYQAAFVILGQMMTTAFGLPPANGEDKRKWQLANLVVNWMHGFPLARLIEQRSGRNVPIAKAIRDVMADIETVARFQAPKYLSCYNDILKVYAAERGVHDIADGPDITMLLELGVSRASEVVMMSLGLSRTATVAIAGYVTADSWTTEECLAWLRGRNIEGMDIPVLVQQEIMDLVESLAMSSRDSTSRKA
ncbi:DEAD/DEAH box helicase [Pseudarthrobacter sp. NPDC092184]|uniref:DEAD/DEAH box helicase n=1 Tax=unclassified Pseudarthrobacter TaxID=2647000 RepID=UPI00381F8933